MNNVGPDGALGHAAAQIEFEVENRLDLAEVLLGERQRIAGEFCATAPVETAGEVEVQDVSTCGSRTAPVEFADLGIGQPESQELPRWAASLVERPIELDAH